VSSLYAVERTAGGQPCEGVENYVFQINTRPVKLSEENWRVPRPRLPSVAPALVF
jgi:hypothetical protein